MRKFFGFVAGILFGVNALAGEQIDFKVAVPDSWALVSYSPQENLWAYESAGGHHRLTVSILYYSESPGHAEQGRFLADFVEVRQGQSRAIAKSVQFGKVETPEHESAWVAKFDEFSDSGRIATTKAISSKVGIATFYLESFSSKEEHTRISIKLLSTTAFAS